MRTSKKLRDLQAKKAGLVASARALTDLAENEAREISAEESTQFEALREQITALNAAIDRENELLAEEASLGFSANVSIIDMGDNREKDEKRGFKSLGDFAHAVQQASIGRKAMDERLSMMAAAPSTFGNESTGADGGFLVPPEYSKEIFNLSQTEDSLLPLTDNIEISGNSMVFPRDETTLWGTDGVRAYWTAEGAAKTPTKPKFGAQILRLQKLAALVPISDELLEDTSALNSYLPGLMADSIRWKVNEALLFGTGGTQPLGCFSSGAAIVLAKDSNQAANTLSLANVTGMIARLLPGCYPRSQWIISPDIMPLLLGLTLGNYPIYMPVNQGIQGTPYGTLMGRPIIVSQHASALSAQGDICLLDPTYIRTITKAGGIQTASSIHLYFDADVTAFRAVFRVDASPKISAPVAQAKSSNTLSAFIQLAAR